MSCLRLVPLLCCVLLPLQGLAQAEEPAPPPGPVTAPPLVPAPGASEEGSKEGAEEGDGYGGYEEDEPRGQIIPSEERSNYRTGSPAIRIPVGILLGTVGATLGALPGTLIMFQEFCLDCSDGGETIVLGFVLGVTGLTLGAALVIDVVGDLLDGEGRFWPTVLGVVLGAVGGLVIGIAGGGEGSLIAAVLGPAVGGVLAYELSSATARREAVAAMASRPGIAPLLTVSPRGGLIGGLAGTF